MGADRGRPAGTHFAFLLLQEFSNRRTKERVAMVDLPNGLEEVGRGAFLEDVDHDEAVSTRTLADGIFRTIWRVASTPFIPGMATSITTTSGKIFLACDTALRPFSASPTTTMSPSASSRARSP